MKKIVLLLLLLFSIVACKKDDPAPLKAYLIHFPFDGTFENLEDPNNNGKQTGGVAFVDDRYGNAESAAQFDGIDDRLNFKNTLSEDAEAFSISAWYKTGTDFFNGNHAVVLRNATVTNFRITKIDSISSMVCFDNYISSDWRSTCNVAATTDWLHLVGVYNKNDDTKLYVNGVLVNQSSSNPSDGVSSDIRLESFLGAIIRNGNSNEPSTFWNGSIDDFRLYQKALSTTEVSAIYNASENDSP